MPLFIRDRCGWACNMSSPSHRPPPSPSQFSRKWGRDGSSHGGVLQRPGLPLSKLHQEAGALVWGLVLGAHCSP